MHLLSTDLLSCSIRSTTKTTKTTTPPMTSPLPAGALIWYDISFASTRLVDEFGNILSVANRAGPGPILSADPMTGGPAFVADYRPEGPAMLWPSQANQKGLLLSNPVDGTVAEQSVQELFLVMGYRDGTATNFAEFLTIVTDQLGLSAPSTRFILGEGGKGHLWQSGYCDRVSINRGAFSSWVLPLGLSVLHISATEIGQPIRLAGVGCNNVSSSKYRGWQGPICEILGYDRTLTETECDQLVSGLRSKWQI